jgi:hypothetical protein
MSGDNPIYREMERAGQRLEQSGLLVTQQKAREQRLKNMLDAQDLAFDYKEGMDNIAKSQMQDAEMTAEHVEEEGRKLLERAFIKVKNTQIRIFKMRRRER